MKPPVPAGDRHIHLEVEGAPPGGRVRIEAAPRLPEKAGFFVPQLTGQPGQSVFDLPWMEGEEGYFRASTLAEATASSRTTILLNPGLRLFPSGQRMPISPDARIVAGTHASFEGLSLVMEILESRDGLEPPTFATGDGFFMGRSGEIFRAGILVGRWSASPGWAQIQLVGNLGADTLESLLHRVEWGHHLRLELPEYRTVQWSLMNSQSEVIGSRALVAKLETDCQLPLDVVLVLDRTSSLSLSDLGFLREAATNFVMHSNLASGHERIGVISFCGSAFLHSALTADRGSLLASIDQVQRLAKPDGLPCEETFVGSGIGLAKDLLSDSGRRRLILLMTDGENSSRHGATDEWIAATEAVAMAAKDQGIRIIALGVGAEPDTAHLTRLVSGSQDYFPAADFAAIPALLEGIAGELCVGSPTLLAVQADGESVIWLPQTAQLHGRIQSSLSGVSSRWRWESGPAPVLLEGEGNDVSVTFLKPGEYRFAFEAHHSWVSASDELTIHVHQSNAPPVVKVIGRSIAPLSGFLQASVEDDGLSSAGLPDSAPIKVVWRQTDGPAVAVFSDPQLLETKVSGTVAGNYGFEIEVTDAGGFSTRERISILLQETSAWESFEGVGWVSVALGGLRDIGAGRLHLAGVRGSVIRAYLYWHGPTDSLDREANASIRFQGESVTGASLGISHDDGWTYGRFHRYANAQAYRADVTRWVHGDGDYALNALTKGEQINVNGVSLLVIYQEPDPALQKDLKLWSGNESNGSFAPAANGRVRAVGLQPDGKVLIAGDFTQAGGVARPGMARLLPDGSLDLAFDPPPTDGSILAMSVDERGRIWISGNFSRVDGVFSPAIARLTPEGQVDTAFRSPLKDGDRVQASAVVVGGLVACGSIGWIHINDSGEWLSSIPTRQELFSLLPRAAGGWWVGGDRVLGWIDETGATHLGDYQLDGVVRSLQPGYRKGIFAGGNFSRVDSFERHGVVLLREDGAVDDHWIPSKLNQQSGQDVRALLFQPKGEDPDDSQSSLIVGGRLLLSEEGFSSVEGWTRCNDAGDSGFAIEPLPLHDNEGVDGLARVPLSGNFWAVGRFSKGFQQHRVLCTPDGQEADSNTGDHGWALLLPSLQPRSAVEVELHVSDGQWCTQCQREDGLPFLDPVIYFDDRQWMEPLAQTICGVDQEQLFTGLSVPLARGDCSDNRGLWDVVKSEIPESWFSASPHIIRSVYSGNPGEEDFVTLVAAVLSTPAAHPGASIAPVPMRAAVPDFISMDRADGSRRWDLLSNDLLSESPVRMALLDARSGVVELDEPSRSIIYHPGRLPDDLVADNFRYLLGFQDGSTITGLVTMKIIGEPPRELPPEDVPETFHLARPDSLSRGPGIRSDRFRYHATSAERLNILAETRDVPLHLYLRDDSGDLVASSWHASAAFGVHPPIAGDVALQFDVPQEGNYWLEVAANRAEDQGSYTLTVDHGLSDEWPVGMFLDGIPLKDQLEVGAISALGRTFHLQIENRGPRPLHDLQLSAFLPEGMRGEFRPDHLSILETGASASFVWVVQGDPSEVGRPLELWLNVQSSEADLEPRLIRGLLGPTAPELFLSVEPRSSDSFHLSVRSLIERAVDSCQFRIQSERGEQMIESSSAEVVWSNVRPGKYRVIAQSKESRSQWVELVVASSTAGAVTHPDHFDLDVPSGAVVLPVLTNDLAGLRLTAVSTPSGGTARITPDGTLLYTPVEGLLGLDRFSYRVEDSGHRFWTESVEVQLRRPELEWLAPEDGEVVEIGSTVNLRLGYSLGSAAPVLVRFTADDDPIAELTQPPFTTAWKPTASKWVSLQARVLDDAGRWYVSSIRRVAVAGSGDQPPEALIDTPGDGSFVTEGWMEVRGTASDVDGGSLSYRLALTDLAGAVVAQINGHEAVSSGILGKLDVTSLRNSVYRLNLTVTSGLRSVERSHLVFLQTELKIGQFSFWETDLEIPAQGVPLVVARRYDSMNPRGGDFGPGWSLGVLGMEVELDEEREEGVEEDSEEPYSVRVGGGRNVTMTLPDGRRATFAFALKPGADEGGVPCFCYDAVWNAPAELGVTLTPIGNSELRFVPFQNEVPPFWVEAGPETPMESFDFRGWILAQADGTRYTLERPLLGHHEMGVDGSRQRSADTYGPPQLTSVRSRTGERIEILHQDGLRVQHVDSGNHVTRSLILRRGAHGFISELLDPSTLSQNGELLPDAVPLARYHYDPETTLLIAVDRLVDRPSKRYATQHYFYTNTAFPHLLTHIQDSRGVVVGAAEYDHHGRLSGLRDPLAQPTTLEHDLEKQTEIIRRAGVGTTLHRYDRQGNVVESVGPDGLVVKRSFDAFHHPISETNAWGTPFATWVLREWDAAGRLLGVTNAITTNRMEYGAQGELIREWDSSGGEMRHSYDDAGRRIRSQSIRAGAIRETTFDYDARGRMVRSVNPLGLVSHREYDEAGQETRSLSIDPEGKVLSESGKTYDSQGRTLTEWIRHDRTGEVAMITWLGHDEQGRTTHVTNALGAVRETRYDTEGRVVADVDEAGRVTEMHYDRRGTRIQTVYPSDEQTPRCVTRIVYDQLGRVAFSQSPARLPAEEDPLSSVTSGSGTFLEYDAQGRVVRSGQCIGLQVKIGLDADGLPFSELVGDPERIVTETTLYDEAGRVSSRTDVRGARTCFGYDEAGRLVVTTNAWGTPLQSVSQSELLPDGRVAAEIDPLGHRTVHLYDPWNQQVVTRWPQVDGVVAEVSRAYDKDGRRVLETNELGVVTAYTYDAESHLLAVTNAVGLPEQAVTRYAYDMAGNQISQTDALGRTTTYVYDPLGRRVQRRLPGGEIETMGYDGAGDLVVRTNFNGRVIRQKFDARHRVVRRWEERDSGDQLLAAFTYTPSGQREVQEDQSGMTYYHYDDLDRLSVKNKPGWGVLSYDYFSDGSVRSTTVEAGDQSWVIRYGYDLLGRLAEVRMDDAGIAAQYQYDLAGNLISTSYANGVTNRIERNARSQVTSLQWGGPQGSLASFRYRMNAAGQRIGSTEWLQGDPESGRNYQWTYDARQRLVREQISGLGQATYRYDAVGNRLSRTSTLPGIGNQQFRYDLNDRIDPDDDPRNANPDFDAGGNMLKVETSRGTARDTYDAEDHLVERVVE